MIDTHEKLMKCIKKEEKLYRNIGYKGSIHAFFTQCEVGKIYRYIQYLRFDEYYTNKSKKNAIDKICGAYFRMRHNGLGIKLGMSIPINTFGEGLLVYHSQGIIVHRDSRCGNNCKLHGLNCIGNNGTEGGDGCPQVGNDLDLGVGAKIIGHVRLGNKIKIGCNAVVCKTCVTDNTVLVGIPAKSLSTV